MSIISYCGFWLWPIMIVFGLAFGIKYLINGKDGKAMIPLFVAVVGLIILIFPFYQNVFQFN